MKKIFHLIAKRSAQLVGEAWVFVLACILIIVWLISGPVFHFSDTWQLIINTSTTIITFLIVFLIQHTQNRDTKMLHLKLDELIRAHKLAHNSVIDLEKLTDSQLQRLETEYKRISNHEQNKEEQK